MAEKLFISYNHKDAALVDTIARRLEIEFGRNNIFYDAWSMQPGDSIIGKMNEGLGEFTTFFFFVSPNSLASKMVSLEWQTALNRAVNNDLKFVAVRIADCAPPVILSDKLYIDLYGDGLDSAVAKMKKIVKSENCYNPLEDVQNMQAEVAVVDKTKARFTIKATLFAEHNPKFAFACENSTDEFRIHAHFTDGVVISGYQELECDDGITLHAHTIQLQRVLKPGFPFVAEMTTEDLRKLRSISVYVLKDAELRMYQRLPITEV